MLVVEVWKDGLINAVSRVDLLVTMGHSIEVHYDFTIQTYITSADFQTYAVQLCLNQIMHTYRNVWTLQPSLLFPFWVIWRPTAAVLLVEIAF